MVESCPIMATSYLQERIDHLEAVVEGLRDAISRMEIGFADRFQRIGNTVNTLSTALLLNNQSQMSNLPKLDFPKYSGHGDDPTEWLNKVDQFFEYQRDIPEADRVLFASFHLDGEANQWWQWLRRTSEETEKEVSLAAFKKVLRARFEESGYVSSDEALSRIKQVGSLRDYQEEFEKLGNRVQGWSQKALAGTFMGGLKPEISEGIRMHRPKSLKDAISLARIREEQLSRERKMIKSQHNSYYPAIKCVQLIIRIMIVVLCVYGFCLSFFLRFSYH